MYQIKKTGIIVSVTIGLMTGALYASAKPDLKKALVVKIEKNVSKSFVQKIQKKAKARKILLVVNPAFTCNDAGFGKKDIFAQGTMYGKNRKDGSLEVSGEGDFKAYSYIRYKKSKRECIETRYTKAYDPDRYGKESYAVIMP